MFSKLRCAFGTANTIICESLEIRSVLYRSLSSQNLVILHFNDVYNVEPRISPEPVGGAARFCTAIKSFQHLKPMVLFSGDAFSPSLLSNFTKGEQMVPVLKEVGTQCAVLGNHDFDHGLEALSKRIEQCNFPWLMSNVLNNRTGRPLGEGKITHIVEWAGHRIGIIGLVEREWLETLSTINIKDVTFLDFVEVGRRLAKELKRNGCDYVIALTHMRTPNDLKVAENIEDVDLILGGHDHICEIRRVNGKYVIKSGTDFRQFNKITVNFHDKREVSIEDINVTSDYPEDVKLKEVLEKYSSLGKGIMSQVLGSISVPLDGRFTSIRTSESNLGNWVCDVILSATGADLVILNSGTFRSDQVHAAGNFTMGDLLTIIPMREPIVVLKISGQKVLEVLENSVCMYPKLEGRFPQVAGITFAFNPTKPPGKRVDRESVIIGGEPLKIDKQYKLATKNYMHTGCDGYTMLTDAEVLLEGEACPELSDAIADYFNEINRNHWSKTKTSFPQTIPKIEKRIINIKSEEKQEQLFLQLQDIERETAMERKKDA